jgi:hypothetical protein
MIHKIWLGAVIQAIRKPGLKAISYRYGPSAKDWYSGAH